MKTRHAAATLVCAMALTAGVSASTDQAPAPQVTSRPAGQPADEAPAPVIRTLPSVTFGTTRMQPQPQTPGLETWHVEAASRDLQERASNRTRTICGLTMTEQSPDVDAKMLLPADRSAGAAVRRVEPKICTPDTAR